MRGGDLRQGEQVRKRAGRGQLVGFAADRAEVRDALGAILGARYLASLWRVWPAAVLIAVDVVWVGFVSSWLARLRIGGIPGPGARNLALQQNRGARRPR